MGRYGARLLWRLSDLLIAAVMLPVALVCAIRAVFDRRRRVWTSQSNPGRLLYLSSATSTNALLSKFGSFAHLFETEGPAADVFDGIIVFWFPGRNSLRLQFANGWTVLEQGEIVGRLYLAGSILYLIRLFDAVVRYDVGVIRALDPMLSGTVGIVLARLTGLRVCISLHADYDVRFKLDGIRGAPTLAGSRRAANALERFALSRADLVLPIRESLRPYATARGVDQSAIRVIPHGIDLEPYRYAMPDPRSTYGIPAECRLLVFAGRLSLENYVDDMVDLLKALIEDGCNVALVMAGGGTEEARLRALAMTPPFEHRLFLPGFLPQEEVRALRQNADVGLALMGGYSLIEAAAAGRPVIAYDTEWHAEIVKDGETGYLLQPGDTASLLRRTLEVLNDSVLSDRLGAAAKDLAFARHDIMVTSEVKRNVYIELLRLNKMK